MTGIRHLPSLLLFLFLVRISSNTSCVNDVILVPTAALGFVGQLEELQAFWSLTHDNRKVFSILHRSHRFSDAGMYSMCDIVEISEYVACLVLTANQLLNLLPPTSCMLETRHDSAHNWLESPEAYNISQNLIYLVKPVSQLKLNSAKHSQQGPICALGMFGKTEADPRHTFPVMFTEKYKMLLHEAKIIGLGINHTEDGQSNQGNEYVVVHWRRDLDQKMRCDSGEDQSVNCETAEKFVQLVLQILRTGEYPNEQHVHVSKLMFRRSDKLKAIDTKSVPKVIYISTNEENTTVVKELQRYGFKVFNNLGLPGSLSSLDKFIVDLQLMIDADYFFAWGSSPIHNFVKNAYSSHKNKNVETMEPQNPLPTCKDNISDVLIDYIRPEDAGFELLPHEISAMKAHHSSTTEAQRHWHDIAKEKYIKVLGGSRVDTIGTH